MKSSVILTVPVPTALGSLGPLTEPQVASTCTFTIQPGIVHVTFYNNYYLGDATPLYKAGSWFLFQHN